MKELVIGTRKSKLALWQADFIRERLEAAGIAARLAPIETKGDQVLNVALHKIGSKGVFTEELEDQLLNGSIDLAVHSAKDVQSSLKTGLHLIAFTAREYPGDVVLSADPNFRLGQEKTAKIGTSSNRRKALLAKFFPQHRQVEIRGNLQTRLRKMQEGQCQAILLAFAGVYRMGMDEWVVERIPMEQFIPPVGQASMAVEAAPAKLGEDLLTRLRQALNDRQTEAALLCERSYLAKMEGGCSVPVFGHAHLEGDNLRLRAGVISLDGNREIREDASGPAEHPEALGQQVAEAVIGRGGKELLEEIRRQIEP